MISFKSIVRRLLLKCHRIDLPIQNLTFYDLLKLYVLGIINGKFSTRAGSIAFSFFLAIFPFLLFILNLIPFITFIDDFQERLLAFIEKALPPGTAPYFTQIFMDIAQNQRAGLLSFVFLFSIFLMANGVNSIFTGFEFSYHTKNNRSIVRQYLVAVGVAIIIAFLLLTAVVATIVSTYLTQNLKDIGLLGDNFIWIEIGNFIVLILVLLVGISILYYFGTKEGKQTRFFSVGSIFTTIMILLTTYLFSLYIENFASYNKLYGSIGTLIILMVYIWLNSNILLLGFELNGTIYQLKQKRP
jgi:membrane protein